jgi:hypothetical protein
MVQREAGDAGSAAAQSASGGRTLLPNSRSRGLKMTTRNTLLASALVAAAMLAAPAAFADSTTLTSGDLSTADHWYGRAGGLIGVDRVAALPAAGSNPGITITYDRDVAQRTNMPLDRSNGSGVTVTYDRDVAARTNMGRSQDSEPIQAAGIPGAKSN